MSYRLIVRPEAEADIRSAYLRYENEVPGLGIQFLDAVDDGLDRISEGPLHYAIIAGGIRRKLLRKFPFGLFLKRKRFESFRCCSRPKVQNIGNGAGDV